VKVGNYIKAVTDELKMLTQQAGKTDVSNLEKEDLRALTVEASAMTGVKLAGLEKPIYI